MYHLLVTHERVSQERHAVTDQCVFAPRAIGNDGVWRVVCDVRHANGRLFQVPSARLQSGDRVLLLSLELQWASNDLATDVVFAISRPTDSIPLCKMRIPAGFAGRVPEIDSLLWRPSWASGDFKHDISQYAGMEAAILNAHSSALGSSVAVCDFELFRACDPFLVFLLKHRGKFPDLRPSDVALATHDAYRAPEDVLWRVSRSAMDRVQRFFRTAVFEQLRYDTDTALVIDEPECAPAAAAAATGERFAGVTALLTLRYMIVSPSVPKFDVVERELNI